MPYAFSVEFHRFFKEFFCLPLPTPETGSHIRLDEFAVLVGNVNPYLLSEKRTAAIGPRRQPLTTLVKDTLQEGGTAAN